MRQLPPDVIVVVVDGSQPSHVVRSALKTVIDVVGLRAKGLPMPALPHPFAHWCTNPPALRTFDPEGLCTAGRVLAAQLHDLSPTTPATGRLLTFRRSDSDDTEGPLLQQAAPPPDAAAAPSQPVSRRGRGAGRGTRGRGRSRGRRVTSAIPAEPQPIAQDATVPPSLSCEQCGLEAGAHNMLVCDQCNRGFHMGCLTPRIWEVPEGTWFCPECSMLGVRIVAGSTSVLGQPPAPVRLRRPSGRPKSKSPPATHSQQMQPGVTALTSTPLGLRRGGGGGRDRVIDWRVVGGLWRH
jgi:hypothetical protein